MDAAMSYIEFQSTYLYKVRRENRWLVSQDVGFNPRTYIRYDRAQEFFRNTAGSFNPRTYIRYDSVL